MKHLPKVGTIVVVKRTGEVGTVSYHYFTWGVSFQFVQLAGQPHRFVSPEGLRYATATEKLRYKLSGS